MFTQTEKCTYTKTGVNNEQKEESPEKYFLQSFESWIFDLFCQFKKHCKIVIWVQE